MREHQPPPTPGEGGCGGQHPPLPCAAPWLALLAATGGESCPSSRRRSVHGLAETITTSDTAARLRLISPAGSAGRCSTGWRSCNLPHGSGRVGSGRVAAPRTGTVAPAAGWDEAAAQMPGNPRGDRDLVLAHIDRRDALVHDLHDGRLPARGVAAADPPAEHAARPRSFNFCGWSVVQRTHVAWLLAATRTDPRAAGLSTAGVPPASTPASPHTATERDVAAGALG